MGTKQRVNLPLVGGSSKARFPEQQSGRTVNMYPETNDADAKAVIALLACPGFFRVADWTEQIIGDPQIRGLHMMGERFFAVIAEKVVEVTFDNDLHAFSTLTNLATLSTFTGRVGISDNAGKLIIGDGTGFYALDLVTLAFDPVLNDDVEQIKGTFSRFIDGYTLYFERDSGRYHYSELNNPNAVMGLNYMTAEGSPDNTVAAVVINREVFILGSESIETHWNSGGSDNAFERISGGFIEHGCAARWSVCKFGNSAAFVGRGAEGRGTVWQISGAGSPPVRISNTAVEKAIGKVLFSNLARKDLMEQITAFAYQDGGHSFYVLNLPAVDATVNSPAQASMTWVYDAATNLWHERGYTNPATGLFERILADHHVVWKGRHYVGCYNVAHILEMSHDYYRDNTLPLVKWRETAGPVTFKGSRGSVHRMELDGNTGHGRDGGVQGSDPIVYAQFCWDGTWGQPVPCPWGRLGARNTRAVWHRCGSGYELVVRITCSEPIPFALTDAWADIEVGR